MIQMTTLSTVKSTLLTLFWHFVSGVSNTFDTINTNRERDHKIADQCLQDPLTKVCHPFVVNRVNSVNSLGVYLPIGCKKGVNAQTNGKMRVL